MERRLITGHSPYEGDRRVLARRRRGRSRPRFRDGADPGRRRAPPDGAYDQAKLVLEIIGEALARAGSGLEHVVRTNIYVTAREHWPEVARAHGEAFGDVRPAATCVVAELLDPRWKVEIEAEAVLP